MASSTPQALLSRALGLQDTIKQTLAQIARLSRLSTSSEEDEAPEDLAADIHESLKLLSDDIAVIHLDVQDLPTPRRPAPDHLATVATLNTTLAHLDEDHNTARARFRSAQLSAKRNREAAARKEKEEYLRELQATSAMYGSTSSAEHHEAQTEQTFSQMTTSLFAGRRREKRDPQATQQDLLLTATSDVTASLRRTHTLLTSELSRSRFAQETLDASNKALEELNTRYGDLNDMLKASRGLVTTLMRSNKSDTWYLETAMYILLGTLAWLVFRRLLYGPAWWLVWLPVRNILRVMWFFGGAAIGLIGRDQAAGEVGRAMSSLTAFQQSTPTRVVMEGSNVPQATSQPNDSQRSAPGSLSEEVGSMAEEAMHATTVATPPAEAENAGRDAEQQRRDAQPPNEQVRRGDGQPLRERDETTEPRNPKKRMFDADKEDAKGRDEL